MHRKVLAAGFQTEHGKRRPEPLGEGISKAEDYRRLLKGGSHQETIERLVRHPSDLPHFARLLFDTESEMRILSSWLLSEMSANGYPVGGVIGELGRALCDRLPEVRCNILQGLVYAQKGGADLSPVIEEVVPLMFDQSDDVVSYAAIILWESSLRGNGMAKELVAQMVLRSALDSAGMGDLDWGLDRAASIFRKIVDHDG
ncbi:MAG: hypothetical protein U0R44_05150 [Candidatus Micrarchaeia archaeon]